MIRKVMLVFGTRPEAIKMCPLIKELQKRKEFECVVCVTGQHREMLDSVLQTFEVTPDYDLNIMREGQSLYHVTEQILSKLRLVLRDEKPDILLVHGDTTSSFAGALAAFYSNVTVGHVEAGLRTYDIFSPYPEEFNRQAVSIISQYNFAPTQQAKENLLREGKKAKNIYVTGNTVVDSLSYTINYSFRDEVLSRVGEKRFILFTAHRRENIGEKMRGMFRAISRISDEFNDIKIVYPVHLNPAVRSLCYEELEGKQGVILTEPMGVVNFHNFLARCYFVVTDSGGIQEEAAALKKPALVMRDTTERQEGTQAGGIKLIGTDEQVIYKTIKNLIENQALYNAMSCAPNPFGDGHACERIADILSDKQIIEFEEGKKDFVIKNSNHPFT